jgi:hypothetical protein
LQSSRWYDQDPTLSMAVSLLQNASRSHQMQTSRYILSILEGEGILARHHLPDTDRLFFLFPIRKRQHFDSTSLQVIELLKRLPASVQLEMALNIINCIYLLEHGQALSPHHVSPLDAAQVDTADMSFYE